MCALLENGAVSGRGCACWGCLLTLGPALAGWSPVLSHAKTPENELADSGNMVKVTGDWVLWLNVKRAMWNLV